MTHWLVAVGIIVVAGCGGTAGVMLTRKALVYPGENDAQRGMAKRVNTRRALIIVWVVVVVFGLAAGLAM
jgi:hypothetical protein